MMVAAGIESELWPREKGVELLRQQYELSEEEAEEVLIEAGLPPEWG